MRMVRSARAGIAVVCASTLVAAPLLVPTTATAQRAEAAIQSITIKVAKKAITVRGAKGLDAGRVEVKVTGRASAEIMMFDRGYDVGDFRKDLTAFERKQDMKAFKRFLANTEILGGVQPGGSGTVVLPKAGEYAVFSFGSRGFGRFTAGKATRSAPMPDVDGKIIGRTGPKWAGSDHMPAKGTFLFKNADRTVPHMIEMQQVAEGTTVDQVMEALQSESQGPPSWALPARMDTGSLSPGRKMTVDYDLPPGQYVVMCFFPDPNMKGMPHAFMGMVEMIHLM
jgi:hypothetical protein